MDNCSPVKNMIKAILSDASPFDTSSEFFLDGDSQLLAQTIKTEKRKEMGVACERQSDRDNEITGELMDVFSI